MIGKHSINKHCKIKYALACQIKEGFKLGQLFSWLNFVRETQWAFWVDVVWPMSLINSILSHIFSISSQIFNGVLFSLFVWIFIAPSYREWSATTVLSLQKRTLHNGVTVGTIGEQHHLYFCTSTTILEQN